VKLRVAIADDVEALFGVQRSASLAALAHVFPPDRYPYPDDEVRERWRDFVGSDARILVAERDGRAVGVAALVDCWLHGLYVVPVEWGSGVAASLHDAAVDAMRSSGCTEARLWVLEENARARRFYARRGWRSNGESRVVPYPPHPLDVGYSLSL
jgi:GNAT superfamily N-acetyltransferase